VEIRLTSSARSQLLALVARERDCNRARATRLVERFESTLRQLANDPSDESAPATSVTAPADGHRLLYRRRNGSVWVIALCEADEP
jgi:hypothetical protein